MLRSIFAFLGCGYSIEETKRLYGVRCQRVVFKIFGTTISDRWKKVGWADGTEEQLFPAPKEK